MAIGFSDWHEDEPEKRIKELEEEVSMLRKMLATADRDRDRLTERLEKVRGMIHDMRVRTDVLLQTGDE